MESIEINAAIRETKSKNVKKLLREGLVPGIIYGRKFENVMIQIGKKEFSNLLEEAGESSLLSLKVGDREIGNVIIKDYEADPVSGEIIHFDFYRVDMNQKITANVNLEFVGESPAVKNEGGVLVSPHDQIEIKCFPKDLIQEIKIDLGRLNSINDVIRIKDLNLPETLEVVGSGDEDAVVSVIAPRSEQEMEDLENKPEESVEKVEGAVKEEPAGKEEEKKEKK